MHVIYTPDMVSTSPWYLRPNAVVARGGPYWEFMMARQVSLGPGAGNDIFRPTNQEE